MSHVHVEHWVRARRERQTSETRRKKDGERRGESVFATFGAYLVCHLLSETQSRHASRDIVARQCTARAPKSSKRDAIYKSMVRPSSANLDTASGTRPDILNCRSRSLGVPGVKFGGEEKFKARPRLCLNSLRAFASQVDRLGTQNFPSSSINPFFSFCSPFKPGVLLFTSREED